MPFLKKEMLAVLQISQAQEESGKVYVCPPANTYLY